MKFSGVVAVHCVVLSGLVLHIGITSSTFSPLDRNVQEKGLCMYVCKNRKTLNNNDLKQVAGKRFSLKQCFAAGDHSNRLRKNSSAHCHLRISQNFSDLCAKCAAQIRIRAFLSTLGGKTPRENSFGVRWFPIIFLIVYDYPPRGR